MDIVVFGAGSLGSLIGGLLAREHHVTLVGRAPHVRAIQEGGLTITGEIEGQVDPIGATTVPSQADLVIVTVKAYDTTAAAEALQACDSEVVLSLQNGIGNEATLESHLEATVLAGTATYGAIHREPGSVTCTGVGEVVLGDPTGGTTHQAKLVGEAFRAAGVETVVATDMPRRLWEKLAVNAGINATTALARIPNGSLAEGPASEVARRAASEAAAVARSRGIDLADDDAVTALKRVIAATATNESSMFRDVVATRRTEIDAINGVIADSELRTPINETMASLLRAYEQERSLRA